MLPGAPAGAVPSGHVSGQAARLRAQVDISALGIFCVERESVAVAALEPVSGIIFTWDCAEVQDEMAIHHPCKDLLPLPGASPA